jgi:AcrR family transcriptional regulator
LTNTYIVGTFKPIEAVYVGKEKFMEEENKAMSDVSVETESHTQVDSTRARLLQVAEELFAEKGFDGTSIRNIASLVGIRASSVMYYFPTKRKLYSAVLWQIADIRESVIDINSEDSDPVREIHNMMEHAVTWAQNNPGRERILMRELMENPGRLEKAKDLVLADLIRTMRSPLDKLQNQGRLAAFDADLLLFYMLGAISYFSVGMPTIGYIIGNKDLLLLGERVKETTIEVLNACLTAEKK